MKRIALGFAALASAAALAAPAAAHEVCLPVIDYTGMPICVDAPVLK
ncbi:MAG TPA: hypothetical protein VGX28_02570 [Frankiaceae bacterium]|jgi:hypothetical protein|nr:hypothetical protein [Frankiaceae bacterium]